jgi:hypothetical protein
MLWVLCLVIIFSGMAYFFYSHRDRLRVWFRPVERAGPERLEAVLDSVYRAIEAQSVTTTEVTLNGHDVRHDEVRLPRSGSLARANLDITRAVEMTGGQVVFGVESSDRRNRWRAVTLGISDGDSLVRQIRLERRSR